MPSDLAVLTMVFDETEHLQIWLNYWRKHLGPRQLYVIQHGEHIGQEQMVLDAGVNLVRLRRPPPFPEMERNRWHFLNRFVSSMTQMNKHVIYTDVDEILVSNSESESLSEILASLEDAQTITPLGGEIIHRPDQEPEPLNLQKPVLGQRTLFLPSSVYMKPCIIAGPVQWDRGGHYGDDPRFVLERRLVNVHLRLLDVPIFRERARRRQTDTQDAAGNRDHAMRTWRRDSAGVDQFLARMDALPISDEPIPFQPMVRHINRNAVFKTTPGGRKVRRFTLREGRSLHQTPMHWRDKL